jgi:predicted HTH domain antitoxin
MQTVTISMRLQKTEVCQLAEAARQIGMERPTFLKRALRRGVQDLMLEKACEAYRRGEATLSRAAELAGLSLREMLLRLRGAELELNYTVEDLEKDLRQ